MGNTSLEKIMEHIKRGGKINDSEKILQRITDPSIIKEKDTIVLLSSFSTEIEYRIELMNITETKNVGESPSVSIYGNLITPKYNFEEGNIYFAEKEKSERILDPELLTEESLLRKAYKVIV